MSQVKVDKYKQTKLNRKEVVAKQRKKEKITKICLSVIGVALAAWIVVSGVFAIIDLVPANKHIVDAKPITEYFEELYAEETESETEGSKDKVETDKESTEDSTAE